MSSRRDVGWVVWWLLAAGMVSLAVLGARQRVTTDRFWSDVHALERLADRVHRVDEAGDGADPAALTAAAGQLDAALREELARPERREDLAPMAPGLLAVRDAARVQAALMTSGPRLELLRHDRERSDPLARAAIDALDLLRSRHEAQALDFQRRAARSSWLAAGLAIGVVALGVGLIGRGREDRAAAAAESRARAAEDLRFRALFERHPSPMWVFDRDTLAFVEVNEAAVHQYGWTREEFLRMTIEQIRPREDVPRLHQRLAELRGTGVPHAGHWSHLRKDGSTLEVEVHRTELEQDGRSLVLVVITDVSERHRLESELRQAQKMEAIGRLAGGVAHDFNNIITAVQGYAGLLRLDLRDRPAAQEWCDEIARAAGRAASLTRQLLAFSRRQVVQPVPLDLNAVLVDMHRMLARLLGEDIDLVTSPAPRLGCVLADPGQVEQILLNLAVNARDAMPEGGLLTIETSDVDLDESYAAGRIGLRPGPYVRLDVTDTGTGMAPEVREHIFEPFFTTKASDKGTGLGLATVYGIVRQSGGAVSVYSEVGAGTTFSVYLPRVTEQGAPAAGAAASGETVLLVEDEAQLRELARTLLAGAGYRVLEAPHGDAALELATAHPQPIHLVLTDLVMPGMRGTELARRITERRPGTRVVYMSGYADDASLRGGEVGREHPFLQKPFAPDELLRAVRVALDDGVG